VLTAGQTEFFAAHGFLVVEDVVSRSLLARLRHDFEAWVAESRGHAAPYGQTMDGRPRFDLEPGHSAAAPGLRRNE